MSFSEDFKQSIFEINEKTFAESTLAAFDFQYHHCDIYRQYCNYLNKKPSKVKNIYDIPFLPIELFKNHVIKSGKWEEKKVFKSSGTTKTGRSKHYLKDERFYHTLSQRTFERFFGKLNTLKIFAILPSYLEQGDSSLINMVANFINLSDKDSGYYLNRSLREVVSKSGKKIIIGVSYALLELAREKLVESNVQVIETGGMKGRGKEITRNELHLSLREGFGLEEIWSEYGMTELLSQAYGKAGMLEFPTWAKCLIRDINDPFEFSGDEKSGGINIIDLANIDTCCFIETKDLGRSKGRYFEVLGRFDNSDIRGCNLMI